MPFLLKNLYEFVKCNYIILYRIHLHKSVNPSSYPLTNRALSVKRKQRKRRRKRTIQESRLNDCLNQPLRNEKNDDQTMKTVRIAPLQSQHMMDQHLSNAAVESAVDAYATRILKQTSPPEACIDESLGPYVTSMLRCSLTEDLAVRNIDEFESLMELLEEQCSLTPDGAETALEEIAMAVKTGIVPVESKPNYGCYFGLLQLPDNSKGSESSSPQYVGLLKATMEQGVDNFLSASEELVGVDNNYSAPFEIQGRTPLKPDRLIPVDLLGVLDDPTTPALMKVREKPEELFPPLGTESKPVEVVKKSGKPPPASSKPSKQDASLLAATLFRPARPRQNSINEEVSPTLQPVTTPELTCQMEATFDDNFFYQQQWEAVVEMLLSINADLSEAAAADAATLGGSDINVAQFIIDQALSAPPVCRHMLNDGCYRSDCSFSHDVDGHTCLFWLRNRCGKGDACRFRHGFSEKLLDGFNHDIAKEEHPVGLPCVNTSTRSQPIPIATKNLVSHNMNTPFSTPQFNSPFASYKSESFSSGSFGAFSLNQASNSLSSSWGERASQSKSSSFSLDQKQERAGFSFASIASKGYKGGSYSSKVVSTDETLSPAFLSPSATSQQKAKFIKIPQDLWNPHVNRNAGAFHIASPLERFKEVSKTVSRNDVIDLHFQSTKTFAIVLETVLPQKLREHGEAWIVTGSGHHVARQTHQKGGGALESAVLIWLETEDYPFVRGRDRNGHGGALLVKER